MSETSGGGFYETAVELRANARTALASYPEALARVREPEEGTGDEAYLHAAMLIVQAVGFEIAAAVWGVAQAIEDHAGRHPR